MFRFWRKSPAPAVRKPPRSENYGGMRPRELQARLELLIDPSLKYHRGIHDTALFLSKYNLVEPIIKPKAMTRDEVFRQVLNCYRDYYMWKLPQWMAMPEDDFKRRTLLKGMQAIMENSFLKDHMTGLGEMPAGVREMLGHVSML